MFVVCCFLYFIINNKDFVRAVKIYLVKTLSRKLTNLLYSRTHAHDAGCQPHTRPDCRTRRRLRMVRKIGGSNSTAPGAASHTLSKCIVAAKTCTLSVAPGVRPLYIYIYIYIINMCFIILYLFTLYIIYICETPYYVPHQQ